MSVPKHPDVTSLSPATLWADLPLRWKGLAVIAVPVVPLLVVSVLVFSTARHQREAHAAVARALVVKAELANVAEGLAQADSGIRGYFLTGKRDELQLVDNGRLAVLRGLQRLATLMTDPHQRQRLVHLVDLARRRPITRLLEFANSHDAGTRVPDDLLAQSSRLVTELRAELTAMQQREDAGLATEVGVAQAGHDRLLAVSFGGVGFGVIAALMVTLAFTRGVVTRVDALRADAARLAAGEPVTTEVDSRDEVGQLTRALVEASSLLKRRDRELHERMTELGAVNHELEGFSYSVSHDLRAPLRHIAGFTTLLEQRAAPQLDDQAKRYLTTIKDAAGRMGRLIDDLLAFSRMGRAQLSKRRVDLQALVNDIKGELQTDVDGRDVEWCIDRLPAVHADPALLRVALMNLLSNALKYSSRMAQTRIEIGARQDPDETDVFVRDNGVGFDMQYADKLFGVFQRLHRADEFDGTGIGLATVRRIVHRHGGRVWAEGKVDGGATFFFALPNANDTAIEAATRA